MIHATPEPDDALRERLGLLDELRSRLGAGVAAPRPWVGRLRRSARLRAAQSSIAIEGFRPAAAIAADVVEGRHVPTAGDPHGAALAAYARAMAHVAVMAGDPDFAWSRRAVLDLHFDACGGQPGVRAGRWREGPVSVTGPTPGQLAYVGPPAADVPRLMEAVLRWLRGDDPGTHVVVRAAMAHLHVTSVHPFDDGNGRVARIVQSLVLARDGLLAPELGSIEEHLADRTADYYAVLGAVQGGRYRPGADATPWVRFCVDAHIVQAQARLDQLAEAADRWGRLERFVAAQGWPDRLVAALELALFDGADRATYLAESGVSPAAATTDLRRLLDAGLLRREGRGPATRYVATDRLRVIVADAG